MQDTNLVLLHIATQDRKNNSVQKTFLIYIWFELSKKFHTKRDDYWWIYNKELFLYVKQTFPRIFFIILQGQ